MERKQEWEEAWDIEIIDGERDFKYILIEKESRNIIYNGKHLEECFNQILSEGKRTLTIEKSTKDNTVVYHITSDKISPPLLCEKMSREAAFSSLRKASKKYGAWGGEAGPDPSPEDFQINRSEPLGRNKPKYEPSSGEGSSEEEEDPKELKARVVDLQKEKQDLIEEKSRLETNHNQKDEQLKQLKSELNRKNNEIEELKNKLEELKGKHDPSTEALIKKLQDNIDHFRNKTNELEQYITNMRKEKYEHETKTKGEIDRLNNLIREKQKEIDEIKPNKKILEEIQPIYDQAIFQSDKEKNDYRDKIKKLGFNSEYLKNISFFSSTVHEILDTLFNKNGDYSGFISLQVYNQIEKFQRQQNELLENLIKIDATEFLARRDIYRSKMEDVEREYARLQSQEINWLPEVKLLFSFFEEETLQNQPGLAEEVNKKLQPLLDRLGFEQICPVKGTEYDPRQHLVEGERQEAGVRRGQMVRVARRGLRKGTEVIQKAKVIIGK